MANENTSRKIFVSYKYKDTNVQALDGYVPGEDTGFLYTPRHYVDKIIDTIGKDHIYKGEVSGDDASHLTDGTIDSRLKEKIFDSSVTVVLLSPNMIDWSEPQSEQWVPNEIAYSLRYKTRGERTSTPNGMLAVALPNALGNYEYAMSRKECGVRSWHTGSFFDIIDKNMFNRKNKNSDFCASCLGNHHHGWDHSYIHPVLWEDFIETPDIYIDRAVSLRDRLDEFDLTKTHE